MDFAKADMVRRHGKIEGKVNIHGLGRLGTRQMTVSSDLDLLVIYEAPGIGLHQTAKDQSVPPFILPVLHRPWSVG